MANDISKHGYRRVYRMLCFLAWCDDDLDPAERKVLESYRTRFELAELEAAMLEAEGKKGTALELGDRDAELRLLIDGAVDITIADHVLAIDEQSRLLKLAKNLNLPKKVLLRHMRKRIEERGITLDVEQWESSDELEDE